MFFSTIICATTSGDIAKKGSVEKEAYSHALLVLRQLRQLQPQLFQLQLFDLTLLCLVD